MISRLFNKFRKVIPLFNTTFNKKQLPLHDEKAYQNFLVNHYKDIVPITTRYYECRKNLKKK